MRHIFIFCIFIGYVFGAVQLEIANKRWQLIGINGVYIDGISPPIFGTSGIVVRETIDVDATYFNSTSTTGVVTIANDKTVGILAIENAYSPTGTRLINGQAVEFEIDSFLTYDGNQTRYRMYLGGQNSKPVIRIDFQSNLSGKSFKVKFPGESIHYKAFFSPDNTFDSPQKLSEDTLSINTVNQTSNIIDVFDTDLSNNSLVDIARNNANAYINKITALLDINATFYTLTNSGIWSLWDSRNSGANLNGFNALNPGRGYWTLISNNISTNPHGLILGDQGINNETHNNIYNGWNLVSFRDSNIRYSPTGFFIPLADFAGEVSISYKDSVDEVNVTSTSTIDAARQINWKIEDKRRKYSVSTNLLAYPALRMQTATPGVGEAGVIVISDDRMDINTPNATNLSGRALINTNYGRYSTLFGDYMIGLELGELNGVDMNQTISISMPGFNSNTIKATDLNASRNKNITATSILTSFQQAAVSSATGVANADASVYRIDINATDIADLDYEVVLMSSNGRFSIQDGNFIRKFKLVRDGDSVVTGSQSKKLSSISQINLFSNSTNVKYIDLANNEFIITSNVVSNLDLLEDSGYTMFLDNPKITNINSQKIAIGAIGKTYTHRNLLSPSVGYNDIPLVAAIVYTAGSATDGYLTDISSYSDDLSGPAMVALDFPTDGPLNDLSVFGKTITQILSASTVEDSPVTSKGLLWLVTDLTKNPRDWFSPTDTQEVFTIKKEKGYWINVKDFTSTSLSIDSSSQISLSTTTHFDNNITISGTDKVGLATNHINHKLSLKINGLNPLDSTAYDVTAIIRGRKFPIIADGSRFNININNISMGLEEAEEGSTNDDNIKIQIYDGLGNSLSNVDYSVNFIKPSKPVITWTDDGEMTITSSNDYELHNKAILDTDPRGSIILENASNIYSSSKITWKDVDGNVSLLRAVSKKKGVYSNMSITPFVPFKDAHVLQTRNNAEVDRIPYSYISNSILKKNNIEIDNGVQFTSLRDQKIMLAYRPETEGVEQLSAFGGTTTMYVKIGAVVIGYITYIQSYGDKYFYIYYNNDLYQGVFSSNDTFATANSAYELNSGTIDFSSLSLGTQGNKVEFNGFSSKAQPIYEPDIITTLGNNTNTPSGQQPQTGGTNPPQPVLPTN